MKLLVHYKISMKDEMDQLLKANNSSVKDFSGLSKYLSELEDIKKEVGFADGSTPKKQKPTMTIAQERIEKYVKILYNLKLHFDLPKKGARPFTFKWKGNISGSYTKNQNFYYEIAAMLYNYSVLYFNQACQLMNAKSKNPAEYLKPAFRFLRIAMWGFHEVVLAVKKCGNTGTILGELTSRNVKANYHLCAGLAYNVLYQLLLPAFPKFTEEQINSFHKSAYYELFRASKMMEGANPKQYNNYKALCEEINAFKIRHLSFILLSKSKEYHQKHEEAVTEGHLGVAIGFLECLKEGKEELKKATTVLGDKEVKALYDDSKKLLTKLDDFYLENKEVYKQKVPTKDQLPKIPESEHKVKPMDQPHCKKPIDGFNSMCNGKMSDNYNQLKNEFALIINNNKNKLNAMIEDIERLKIDEYRKNNVDVILRIALSSKDLTLENKLNEIKEIHGGLHGYTSLINSLQDFMKQNDNKAKQIKKLIEDDYARDQQFYSQHGVKLLSIKDRSNGILPNFERHGITLTGLKKKDKLLLEEYKKNQELLKRIEEDKVLSDLDKLKTDVKGSEQIQNLIKKNQLLTDIFRLHIDPKKKLLYDYLKELNVDNLVLDILFNKKSQEGVYEDLNENLSSKVEEFRNMITQINKALAKIAEVAKQINMEVSKNNSNSLNYQQKIITDINNVYLLYQSILNNLELHDNLLKGAGTLEQLMNDFSTSKEAQKEEMMKNIGAFRGINLKDMIGMMVEQQMSKLGGNQPRFD